MRTRVREPLLERDQELALLEGLSARAAAGHGSLLAIRGEAGVGKTRFVEEGASRTREAGMEVLMARGSELECDFAFGVVRQLLEPVLLERGGEAREALLTGAAGLAAGVFDLAEASAVPSPDPSFATLHGLYWLTANLTARRPLAIWIDDAHWSDEASLRWLAYIARRLEGLSVLVVIAARPSEPGAKAMLVDSLVDEAPGELTALRPLSAGAVKRLAEAALGGSPEAAFCEACHDVTGGNPFLLHELLAALAADSTAPTAAAVPRVRELGPQAVSQAILRRLSRLAPAGIDLARAVAVLGPGAQLTHAAALAGLDLDAAADAVDALAEIRILTGERPLDFVHPVVRQAVYRDLPAGRRGREHARAARLLARGPHVANQVAGHLLLAEPVGDEWTVTALRGSARIAFERGAPEAAVSYLSRALAEPPPETTRVAVLRELGSAEVRAGELASPGATGRTREPAIEHLAQALELSSEPRERARIALELGDALWGFNRMREAVATFDRGLEELGDSDRELSLMLDVHATAAARLDLSACQLVARRLEGLGDVIGATPAERLVAGVLALDRCFAGEPAPKVAELARRALVDGQLPSGGTHASVYPAVALVWSDQLELVQSLLDRAAAQAREQGAVRRLGVALCWRAKAAHLAGHVSHAEADASEALRIASEHGLGAIPVTYAFLADALIERGELDSAAATLEAARPPQPLTDYAGWNYLLHCRGRIRLERGEVRAALKDFQLCGDRQERWLVPSPAVIAWRSAAALACAALGDEREARRLAVEEVALARASASSRATGVALRTAGVVTGGPRGRALLEDAVEALESSPARLELARALIELGRDRRRAGELGAARDVLRRALDLAYRCGASAIARKARDELVAAGARPRRPLMRGEESLTPAERRVAEVAAGGLSNRDVAQRLFVTEKTVAGHLTAVYEKLGIGSRDELAEALGRPIPSELSHPQPPGELTPRELDVLRLVARGLTDAQVAHELVVSPRTVSAHLRSIYRKLDVHSRSAATRYALEHDLT